MMRILLLFTVLALSAPLFSQEPVKMHKEEPARPIKTYQGAKEVKQLFFIATDELKACFVDEKIPVGFPAYNAALDATYNKQQIRNWMENAVNRALLNEEGFNNLTAYCED
jgi:hypothetical protein